MRYPIDPVATTSVCPDSSAAPERHLPGGSGGGARMGAVDAPALDVEPVEGLLGDMPNRSFAQHGPVVHDLFGDAHRRAISVMRQGRQRPYRATRAGRDGAISAATVGRATSPRRWHAGAGSAEQRRECERYKRPIYFRSSLVLLPSENPAAIHASQGVGEAPTPARGHSAGLARTRDLAQSLGVVFGGGPNGW